MYHIKPDKRSRASADTIADGLLLCLQSAPLSAVSVSDLHRASGVSRATFYRLFDTVDDVLRYRLEQSTREFTLIDTSAQNVHSRQMMQNIISAGMRDHAFLQALVNNGRFDLLYQYTERSFRINSTPELFGTALNTTEQEYILAQLSMSLVAVLITWERNGRKETAEQITEYLKKYIQTAALNIRDAE